MGRKKIRESHYKEVIDFYESKKPSQLSVACNYLWHNDPKCLLFVLSRYKFVAKMLSGKEKILEIGCGDAFGTRIVQQAVGSICAIDCNPQFIKYSKKHMDDKWKFDCKVHDILAGPLKRKFDAAYAIDVIEHIPKKDEERFMHNIVQSIKDEGVLILGTPSIGSQSYASDLSKKGHVNCKDHKELKELVQKYFYNAFIFSMNDEVVHTGFYPLAHYLFALCAGKKPITISSRFYRNKFLDKRRKI